MRTLQEVRDLVQELRREFPGAAVLILHEHPVTPRLRVFEDDEHPDRHLSADPSYQSVEREFKRLREAGRIVILCSAERLLPHLVAMGPPPSNRNGDGIFIDTREY